MTCLDEDTPSMFFSIADTSKWDDLQFSRLDFKIYRILLKCVGFC